MCVCDGQRCLTDPNQLLDANCFDRLVSLRYDEKERGDTRSVMIDKKCGRSDNKGCRNDMSDMRCGKSDMRCGWSDMRCGGIT